MELGGVKDCTKEAPTPTTRAILTQLKAGDLVHQAGELHETLRESKVRAYITSYLEHSEDPRVSSFWPRPSRLPLTRTLGY